MMTNDTFEDDDILAPRLSDECIGAISSLGLAHIGDAVYELMTRSWLCAHGAVTSGGLHAKTVSLVRATAQASASKRISGALNPEELAVFRRGRNSKINSVPTGATVSEYHAATGLEALFGWLYLRGERKRLTCLFKIIME